MDTVRLAWDSGVSPFDIQQRVEWLLELGRASKIRDHGYDPERAYRRRLSFRIDGHDFCLLWQPRFFRNTPLVALSCHLSKFVSYEQLCRLSELILGSATALEEAQMKRVDACVNLAVPFDTFFKGVFRASSRRVSEWGSPKGRSLYLGQYPDEWICYEKEVSASEVDWPPIENPDFSEIVRVVRVERRYYGRKIPICSFKDIEQLRAIRPFDVVKVLKIDPAILKDVSSRKRRVLESFLYKVDLYGFQAARKSENKKGNFAKSIGRYLTDVSIDFDKAWNNRLNRFFGNSSSYITHNPRAESPGGAV